MASPWVIESRVRGPRKTTSRTVSAPAASTSTANCSGRIAASVASTGNTWIQFKAHYYLYAILFLMFDVEVLFLLPFAVAFTTLPVGALVAMLVFILLLAEGLVWAWHHGHLEWK